MPRFPTGADVSSTSVPFTFATGSGSHGASSGAAVRSMKMACGFIPGEVCETGISLSLG